MEVIRDFRNIFPTVMDRAYKQSKEFRLVREIMSQDVVTINREASMDEAAKIMGSKHIGSLIVVKDKKPSGIITERDLLSKVFAKELSPGNVIVGDVMSSPLISINLQASIKEAAQMMIREKGRLVVFESENLVGILTASDLIKSLPWVSETRLQVDLFMTKKVVTSEEITTIASLAKIMGEKRIGSVVITNEEGPIGIFTERDLLTTFLAKDKPLNVIVGEVCSSPLFAVPSGTTVDVAANVMVSKHIKRLPIVADEEMIGIVTARDLVEAYAK